MSEEEVEVAFTEFDLDDGVVTLRIFAPQQHGPPHGDWSCRYEIAGLNRTPHSRTLWGVDSYQALSGAMHLAAVDLYTSDAHRQGRLRRGGDRDLLLLVPKQSLTLVPDPYRPFDAMVSLRAPTGEQFMSSVSANSLEDAKAKLEARFGDGTVLRIWEQGSGPDR